LDKIGDWRRSGRLRGGNVEEEGIEKRKMIGWRRKDTGIRTGSAHKGGVVLLCRLGIHHNDLHVTGQDGAGVR
jgi:hypothetical protein